MKRLIVLLSASVLGLSCGRHCDFRDVAVFWRFPNANASADLSCADAGVQNVRITIDGSVEGTFACLLQDVNGSPVQGILLTDFANRAHQFQIEGLDASGNVIYLDQFTFTPSACGTNTADRTLTPIGGGMTIRYSFVGGANCTPPQSGLPATYIWFELLGPNSSAVYSTANHSTNTTAIPCGAGNATIVLQNAPFGDYTLTRMQEVDLFADNTFAIYHFRCAPTVTFQHRANGDVFDALPMAAQAPGGILTCFP